LVQLCNAVDFIRHTKPLDFVLTGKSLIWFMCTFNTYRPIVHYITENVGYDIIHIYHREKSRYYPTHSIMIVVLVILYAIEKQPSSTKGCLEVVLLITVTLGTVSAPY
jgi:hypothetical protein